ncbi:uncharacterized protein LOC121417249 [Lytechinus variegatus]|uniref:uncharacterized protein LOC121417249 n=1 Tax=Lytechinus variegatus TaxID=7654 RepID=UPI001BB20AC0|nr:uncharacterized protein LOC121417249 [Lytechinus variegatus]
MEITCPQSTMGDSPKVLEEMVIRYCKDHKPTFELDTTNTREAKMNVKFILKQSTRSELLVPMNLIALSYGKSMSEPVIAPPTSTSVPTQDDCQFHGCQKRKIPDDLLNRLAKDIPSGNYYDLCEKLEYGFNQADNILAKHKTDFTKATRECFAGWTNKATRNLADLHKVLFSAGLGGKIDHTRKV